MQLSELLLLRRRKQLDREAEENVTTSTNIATHLNAIDETIETSCIITR